MDVKIGIADSGRELTIKTDTDRQEVQDRVVAALADGGVVSLDDDKGRRYLVAASRVAYVEIGEQDRRAVGFLPG